MTSARRAQVTGNAVLLARNSASRRIRKRLRELGQQLGPHRHDPDAEAVFDQISTLTAPSGS